MNKYEGINFGWDWGIEECMYWESERNLIVSILTREVVGGKQSQDLFSHRNVRWREGTTLMVKFGRLQSVWAHAHIRFWVQWGREYRVLSSTDATSQFTRAQYIPRADIDLGLGVLNARAVIWRKTQLVQEHLFFFTLQRERRTYHDRNKDKHTDTSSQITRSSIRDAAAAHEAHAN